MLRRRDNNFIIKEKNNARDVALFVFLKITEERRKSNSILREIFDESDKAGWGLARVDKAFIEKLVIGSLSRLITIDEILDGFVKKPIRTQKPVIRAILRISAYQILYMDKVPHAAACNEGVRLAKLHGLDGLSGFVNGVLRALARDFEEDSAEHFVMEENKKYSLPADIYNIIREDYGEKSTEIFKTFLEERRDTVRFNISRTDAKDSENLIKESIIDEGFLIEKIDMEELIRSQGAAFPKGKLPVMYEVTGGGDITKSTAFKKGWITMQDPSSALVASYAAPKENDKVIDVCAAPGGKTMALADLINDNGIIEARDVSESKIKLIESNIKRCGFKNIRTKVLDALVMDEESLFKADAVIADLPCSGLGVIAKKPDIKLNFMPYSVSELRGLQRDMLSQVSKYVKPGGKLIYSTCTLTRAENEENSAWTADVLGFKLLSEVLLLPGPKNDGFYIAVFERKY